MIKVLNVISDTNIGGAGKCVLTFLKYYNKELFDLAVVVPAGSLLKPEIEALGGRCIEVDGIADKSLDWGAVKKLLAIFRQEKPDIVHAHASMAARVAARQYGKCKIVYTRHSVFEPEKRISRGLGKLINGAVNNATADKIIAVAEAAKDNLTATGVSEKKIIVIQNGVEPLQRLSEEEMLRLKSNYNVEEGEYLLGIAARLNEVKGHTDILEAVKLLIDDGIRVKLLIAGTGDYEPVIREKIAELGIEANVVMAGFVTDVTGMMNILDCNVNASFGTEATSLSLLEGMRLGLPAVVSDFGGNPGVITEGVNGYLFPTRDVHSLYQKLKLLLADPETYERIRQGCKRVFEEKFRAEAMTGRIEQVYLELLNKGGQSR